MIELLFVLAFWFIVAKVFPALHDYENRQQRWRDADARERARIVRHECAWRVIGRAAMCGGLALGAFALASPVLAVIWGLGAWRMVKPTKDELRQAASFRSTGEPDEPPYSW